jgi:ABC-2 type transport system permease protein
MMTFTIALRELRGMFLSPLAWTILAVTQAILGFTFYWDAAQFSQQTHPQGLTVAVVLPLYAWASVILLFVTPLLTMRLVAEERRNQTLPLLFSAPVSMTEIVLGKYLGVLLYMLILVAMLSLMPLSLLFGATLDFGLLFTAVTGLVLLLASFAAIGLFMSTLTQYPAIAAVGTFGALFLLWVFELSTSVLGDNVLSYLSIINHYVPFLEGVMSTADVAYYLIFAAVFLVLSIRRLEVDRLGA